MSGRKPSVLSPLNRAMFGTRLVMVWERILPALFPYVLLAGLIAVAAQWGLFVHLSPVVHAGILAGGLLMAIFASIRAVLRFRTPSFSEMNNRLAVDNEVKAERLIAMRHEADQPSLKVGKAKAGIAAADPFALRFVVVVAAVLGFLVLGPVPWSRVAHGFMPFAETHFSDASLAER